MSDKIKRVIVYQGFSNAYNCSSYWAKEWSRFYKYNLKSTVTIYLILNCNSTKVAAPLPLYARIFITFHNAFNENCNIHVPDDPVSCINPVILYDYKGFHIKNARLCIIGCQRCWDAKLADSLNASTISEFSMYRAPCINLCCKSIHTCQRRRRRRRRTYRRWIEIEEWLHCFIDVEYIHR